MQVSPPQSQCSRNSDSSRTKQEFKQVKLDFAGTLGKKQFVVEKKKKVKTNRAGFFNDDDVDVNLPTNISDSELYEYLKAELMGIENKMAQLTIRKQKILQIIDGIEEEVTTKIEQMKYEHIEMEELLISRDDLKKVDKNSVMKKCEGYEHSLFNLATSNFSAVDFSLFPLLDSECHDGNCVSENNIIVENLQSQRIEGLSITNQQLKTELKRLESVGKIVDEEELRYLGSQYGIKSEDEV